MSTPVDICNVALARLGDRATVSSISPSDGSPQADHCARFYPLAVKALLATHRWSFAIARTKLASYGAVEIGQGYILAVPASCVSIIEVVDPDRGDQPLHYTYETHKGSRVIVCESDNVYIRYVTSEVNPSLFPATFVDALTWLLASQLAGTLTPGTTGAQMAGECLKYYETLRLRAIHEDAQQTFEHVDYRPAFLGDYEGGPSHAVY